MACESCTERLQREMPQDSHANYVRGLLFGVGAAIVGMACTPVSPLLREFTSVTLRWRWLACGQGHHVGVEGIRWKALPDSRSPVDLRGDFDSGRPHCNSYQIKKRESQSSQEKLKALPPSQSGDQTAGQQTPPSDQAAQQGEERAANPNLGRKWARRSVGATVMDRVDFSVS